MRFAIQPSLIALALVASPCLAQGLPPGIYVPTNEDGFRNAAPSGFGDLFNSGASSMQWFKGDLYVGTTRAAGCVTLAGLASKLPLNLYPFVGKDCPPDVADLPLAAEIWRYSPGSGQ